MAIEQTGLAVEIRSVALPLLAVREKAGEGFKVTRAPTTKPTWVVFGRTRRKPIAGSSPAAGAVGKTAVVGVRSRPSNEVRAHVVASADGVTLQFSVHSHVKDGSMVYADEAGAYNGMVPVFGHEAVNHSTGEYVRGMRAHKGTRRSGAP